MKTTLFIVFGTLVASLCLFSADEVVPRGAIDVTNADVLQVLDVYKAMTGAQLVTDSRVKTVRHGITLLANPSRKEEAVKLLQKALLEQAGVVLTRLDDKRVSVTYNDALPITQAKKAANGH